MDKQWKFIEGWEDKYKISSDGEIIKLFPRGGFKYVNPIVILSTGYHYIELSSKSIKVRHSLSRLVMKTFVGESNLEVNHKDRDRYNNKLSNLEYVTPRENTNHCKDKTKTSSKYRGVTKVGNRWVAQIRFEGKKKYLGIFKDEEEASNIYQDFLKKNNLQTKYYD